MNINTLIGMTLTGVTGCQPESEIVGFTADNGREFRLYHIPDCCEIVRLCEVVGDPSDLLGSPVTQAEESSNQSDLANGDSQTWTFYRLATAKGQVVLRWLGESNGYYSESVDFAEIGNGKEVA